MWVQFSVFLSFSHREIIFVLLVSLGDFSSVKKRLLFGMKRSYFLIKMDLLKF